MDERTDGRWKYGRRVAGSRRERRFPKANPERKQARGGRQNRLGASPFHETGSDQSDHRDKFKVSEFVSAVN
jgi:hypothetical protein